jgi:hypothetical protein
MTNALVRRVALIAAIAITVSAFVLSLLPHVPMPNTPSAIQRVRTMSARRQLTASAP